MDLGATVCTPRSPSCGGCPVQGFCSATRAGQPERYPVKAPKPARPVRHGDAFVIVKGSCRDRHVLLRRRPEKGLLGGMMEVPCTEWTPRTEAEQGSAVSACWMPAGTVRHTFTHFYLKMRVFAAGYAGARSEARGFGGQWVRLDELPHTALPTVMKKAVAAGFEALGDRGQNRWARATPLRLLLVLQAHCKVNWQCSTGQKLGDEQLQRKILIMGLPEPAS